MLLVGAGIAEGVGPRTLLLPLVLIVFGWILIGISMVLARFGVARPDLDVVQFIVRRPTGDHELPPISIGASFLQLFLSIATIPLAKALSPDILFGPELGPSREMLIFTLVATAVTAIAVYFCWRGRIEWQAPRDQQREAEKFA